MAAGSFISQIEIMQEKQKYLAVRHFERTISAMRSDLMGMDFPSRGKQNASPNGQNKVVIQ